MAADPRLDRLDEPHVKPLMNLICQIRSRGVQVPNVDPNDGGILAGVLVLLETPGPQAVRSGFVSRDNPDPSARNLGQALDRAGLARKDVLLWNVVPYCISTANKNGNATAREIHASAPDTQAFLESVLDVRAIVFAGVRAQRAIRWLHFKAGVRVLPTYHTGAQAYNRPDCREDIHRTFSEAFQIIDPHSHTD